MPTIPNIPYLAPVIEKAKALWEKLSGNQRILAAVAGLVLVLLLAGFLVWLNQEEHEILYTNLVNEDANKIITFLKDENVSYELLDDGTTITVPRDQVYDLRVRVAGETDLVGSGIGFEIFDEVQVGQTEFVQRINYQRALQGELSRTLSELPNVESARVHLVMPQRSLFIEEQQPPSASVILSLINTKDTMSQKEVDSIVSFLIMSIEGLDKHHVSISDNAGRPIYIPEEDGIGAVNTQLEYRMRFENVLETRISELLDPILGPGKTIPKVSAELDYSQRTTRSEMFDPDSQVVRSEQTSEETQRGTADVSGQSPDINFRGDGLTGSLSTQEGNREQATRNYEINKIEENVIGQMGEVKRLTIAVAVDGSYVRNEEGQLVYTERTQAELDRIRELVAHTVGFNASRGDTIEVSTIPFGNNEVTEPDAMQLVLELADRMVKPLLSAILVFLFIMLIVRPILMTLIRPRVESGELLEGLEGLPAAEEQLALFEAQNELARMYELEDKLNQELLSESLTFTLENDLSTDELKAKTLQLAEKNAESALIVIRRWMNDDATITIPV